MTKMIKCDCKHEWQDGKYGKGMRVHNSKFDPKTGYTCTVCGKINKEK